MIAAKKTLPLLLVIAIACLLWAGCGFVLSGRYERVVEEKKTLTQKLIDCQKQNVKISSELDSLYIKYLEQQIKQYKNDMEQRHARDF